MTMRKRDAASEQLHYRFYEIRDTSGIDSGEIVMVASTDAAVRFGDYREVLDHTESNVDFSACRALLINHDPNQLAGPLGSIKFDGHQSVIRATIDKDAKMQSGVSVRNAVKSGALKGVSIGYGYEEVNTSYDEATRTVTAKKWRLAECSLTPIPRDTDSMVRSFDSLHQRHAAANPKPTQEYPMDPIALAALCDNHARSISFINTRIKAGEKDLAKLTADVIAHESAGDESTRAAAIAAERAALLIERDITLIAESHGLPAAIYRSIKTVAEATTKMLADKAAAAEKARGGAGGFGAPHMELTVDAMDKYRMAAVDGMLARSSLTVKKEGLSGSRPYQDAYKDLEMRNTFSFSYMVKDCAFKAGEKGAYRWSGEQVARWVKNCPRVPGTAAMFEHERAANDTYGQFPGIMANYMDKAVSLGFQGYENITYNKWTRPRPVNDFKPFINAALTMGNLVLTTENVAFPELVAKDLSYNAQLGMWGGTVTLTYQALVSDDLGEFFRNIGMAGVIAQRTVDKQVYNVLTIGPGATVYGSGTGWGTSALSGVDTITGAAIGTSGKLDVVRGAFRKKITPAGQFLGNVPKYVLYPIPLSRDANQALGMSSPSGEPLWLASNIARTMEGIECQYLDDPSITGNSATKYYLVGDSSVDTLIVATLGSLQVPQVAEFDPGATADRKFKVMYPFVAYIPVYTDGTSIAQPGQANIANRPVGITQGGP